MPFKHNRIGAAPNPSLPTTLCGQWKGARAREMGDPNIARNAPEREEALRVNPRFIVRCPHLDTLPAPEHNMNTQREDYSDLPFARLAPPMGPFRSWLQVGDETGE